MTEQELQLTTEEEVWDYCDKDENVNKYFIWKGPNEKYASLYIIERKTYDHGTGNRISK